MAIHQRAIAGFSLITTLHQICFYFQLISANLYNSSSHFLGMQDKVNKSAYHHAYSVSMGPMQFKVTMHSSLSVNSFTTTALFQK